MKNFLYSFLVFTSFLTYAQANSPQILAYASDTAAFPTETDCYFTNSRFNFIEQDLLVPYVCFGRDQLYSELWKVSPAGDKLLFRSEPGNLLKSAYVWKGAVYTVEYSELAAVAIHESREGQHRKIAIPSELAGSHIHDMAAMGDCLRFRYSNRAEGLHGEGCFQDEKFKLVENRFGDYFHPAFSSDSLFVQKVTRGQGHFLQVRLAPEFLPVTVIEEHEMNPQSSIRHVRNTISVNGDHWAVVVTTVDGLALAMGEKTTVKYIDLASHFKDVDYWGGALTSQGEYVFRGKHHDGRYGLWKISAAKKPELILKAGDKVERDGYEFSLNTPHLFMGPPEVDSQDRIYIGVGLDWRYEKAIGQAILKLP